MLSLNKIHLNTVLSDVQAKAQDPIYSRFSSFHCGLLKVGSTNSTAIENSDETEGQGLERIIVHAQKTAQVLNEVPISVSAIGKDKIQDNLSYWKPVSRINHDLFDELEKALELSFRDDFKQFYGSFWSNGICVEREDINFSLIQIWNEEDQEKLKENILGHAFAKLKSKQPLSYFIGCTFGDDTVCIDHESGDVVLEKPGRKAHKVLAPSLEAFLLSLHPTLDEYNG